MQPFRNSKLVLPPKNFLKDNFERNIESVREALDRINGLAIHEGQGAFQDIMLKGLGNGQVGMYSHYHDAALWKYGYDSPKAIRCAYM